MGHLNNWIEVSADRLTGNFQAIQTEVGPATTILAVVKANAYGHGAETCAPILVRAGAVWLGVTCAEEGARIRRTLEAQGLDAEILIMSGFLPGDVELIHQHRLTPVLWTRDQVDWLAGAPGTKVHLEVDTGMGRQGVASAADLEMLLAKMRRAGLTADGIFTHFCSSEVAHAAITAEQKRRFEAVIPVLERLGCRPTWIHAANSSAIDNPADPEWLRKLAEAVGAKMLVRPGLALYGYTLPIEGRLSEGDARPHLHDLLRPALTWKAHVLATRRLAPGDTVGYNALFTADRPMRVALLPVGYADGLRRELSSAQEKPGGWAMIRGQKAPILGRISMNLTVVDVTGIDAVDANEEAVLLGDGITADDHAALAGTIAYEILCGIHPCN
jgi:alanine racemase